ncbi:MAG: hypothetical protein ACI3X4_03410, partial [Bacteroidaceae bacterium]
HLSLYGEAFLEVRNPVARPRNHDEASHPSPFRLSQSDSLKAKNYHRSFENLTVNILGAIAAYCMFPKKPCINLQ